jgi:Protein of unknown function (DUF2442)
MRSAAHGKSISNIEVTNIGPTGFWLLLEERELFLSFELFPWFQNAQLSQVFDVEFFPPHHLYWPKLDIDLSVDSIEHPERFPLKSKS